MCFPIGNGCPKISLPVTPVGFIVTHFHVLNKSGIVFFQKIFRQKIVRAFRSGPGSPRQPWQGILPFQGTSPPYSIPHMHRSYSRTNVHIKCPVHPERRPCRLWSCGCSMQGCHIWFCRAPWNPGTGNGTFPKTAGSAPKRPAAFCWNGCGGTAWAPLHLRLIQLPMEQQVLFSYRFLKQYPCADEITYQQ